MQPLATGFILNNRYRIVKLIGEGGYGAVYRMLKHGVRNE